MNKADFLELLSKNNNITKKKAKESLEMVLSGIENVIENKDEVTFVGFGTFGVKERKERIGTHPITKEKITIPSKNAVFFKAGKPLKDLVK